MSFLSLIIGFLLLLGSHNQPISVSPGDLPRFDAVTRMETAAPLPPEGPLSPAPLPVLFFDDLTPAGTVFFRDTVPAFLTTWEQEAGLTPRIHLVPPPENATLMRAALALKCAGEGARFKELFAALHKSAAPMTDKTLDSTLKELNFTDGAFGACLTDARTATSLAADRAAAAQARITAFPFTVIGPYQLAGAQPPENLEYVLLKVLNRSTY